MRKVERSTVLDWVREVDAVARADARHPVIIEGARRLAGALADRPDLPDAATVAALAEGVRLCMRYLTSVDDVVFSAVAALAHGSGDCDQQAAVVACLGYAAGLDVRWCVHPVEGAGHAWVELRMTGRSGWVPCDTTHPEGVGADPRRLLTRNIVTVTPPPMR